MTAATTIVREKNFNDFVLRLQYVNPEPSDPQSDHEPAIVIARPKRLQSRSIWVIMLSAAWKYVDGANGNHSKYMVVASEKICHMLGLGNAPETRFRVAEAIVGTLEELLMMPPWTELKAPAGHIQGSIGEQTIDVEVH